MEEKIEVEGLNLYQGVRGLAIKILNRIDRTDAYLEKLLDIEIKNSNFSGLDKALLFEIVHGVIRWLGRIDWILNGFIKDNSKSVFLMLKMRCVLHCIRYCF